MQRKEHDLSDSRRVVVTGQGVVSSLGVGKQRFWQSLIEGKSGIREVQSFDTSMLAFHRAGEVQESDWDGCRVEAGGPPLGRASRFAVAASKLALQDASLLGNAEQLSRMVAPEEVGVIIGTTSGEQTLLEEMHTRWLHGRLDPGDRSFFSQYSEGALSCKVARTFGLRGCNVVVAPACSSGNLAIAWAMESVRRGRARFMLAGASDCLNRYYFYGFSSLRAFARERCQPFDKNRTGLLPGEGAAVLVLESLESALARGARIYSEILGYGVSGDTFHVTAPNPEGMGFSRAIQAALHSARLQPDQVQYVSAHGTGTPRNDLSETRGIKKVFGDHAYRLAVSSIKSMTGHAAGAASALEAVACNMAISEGLVPPTINYEERDPQCDLDYVPNQTRRLEVDCALNNSSAFWGCNAVTAFAKCRREPHAR